MTPDDYERERRRLIDRRYRKARNYRIYKGEPTSLVPADPAGKHVRELHDLGWSYNALEAATGQRVTSTTLANLAAGAHPSIERNTAAAALSLPYTLAPTNAVPDEAKIPTLGATRRVKALMRLGWTHTELRARGVVSTHLIDRQTPKQILAWKWRKVDAVYRELAMQPGPSKLAASRAERAGYASPLSWDDIDSPTEKPSIWVHRAGRAEHVDPNVVARILNGENVHATRAERIEVCRRWVETGRSLRLLEEITGWKIERYYRIGDAA